MIWAPYRSSYQNSIDEAIQVSFTVDTGCNVEVRYMSSTIPRETYFRVSIPVQPSLTEGPLDPEYCLNSIDTQRRMIMVQITSKKQESVVKKAESCIIIPKSWKQWFPNMRSFAVRAILSLGTCKTPLFFPNYAKDCAYGTFLVRFCYSLNLWLSNSIKVNRTPLRSYRTISSVAGREIKGQMRRVRLDSVCVSYCSEDDSRVTRKGQRLQIKVKNSSASYLAISASSKPER